MPVMSLLATEINRARFRADCQAFAPASQAAFEAYLRQVSGLQSSVGDSGNNRLEERV
jgi:hypothetical protein